MKHVLLAFMLVVAGALAYPMEEEVSPAVGNVLAQAYQYIDQGETGTAIALIDDTLSHYPGKSFDRYALLNCKFDLLSKSARTEEALAVLIEKANIVTSPRQALLVAGFYIKLKEWEHALDWLEESVSRGLLSYAIFDDEIYDPLRASKRFMPLVETIKNKIGIGRPAKAFSSSTIDNKKISLARFTGKVVLIEFWATWCPPCMKQMPYIKKYFNEFKDKNFEMIGVTPEKKIDKLENYLRANGLNWLNVANDKGQYDELAAIYNVNNIPASFLIDKKGILRHVNLTENDLRKAIRELTNE